MRIYCTLSKCNWKLLTPGAVLTTQSQEKIAHGYTGMFPHGGMQCVLPPSAPVRQTNKVSVSQRYMSLPPVFLPLERKSICPSERMTKLLLNDVWWFPTFHFYDLFGYIWLNITEPQCQGNYKNITNHYTLPLPCTVCRQQQHQIKKVLSTKTDSHKYVIKARSGGIG